MSPIFLKILNMSISAGWLVLAVILLRLLLNKAPKWIRCIMWGLVGIRLVFPFSIESIFSLIPSKETIPENIIYEAQPQIHSGFSTFNNIVNPVISQSLSPDPAASVNPLQTVASVASIIWVIGIFIMLVYSFASYLHIRYKVRESIELKEKIMLCDNINTPFFLGIFRPRIYLPSSMDEKDTRYVISHENTHLKRYDNLWKPLGFLLLSVYWFNPLMWIAYILLCRDIELACDEKVIRDNGNDYKKPYSTALINCSVPRKMIAACPLAFGETSVKGRVKSVLNYKKPAFWIIILAVLACVITAVCFLTNPKTEVGDIKSESEYKNVKLELVDISADGDDPFIEVKWINNNDKEICFGAEFHLYRIDGDNIIDCDTISDRFYDMLAYSVKSGTKHRYSLADFDLSKDGRYRFETTFFFEDTPKEEYSVYLEFDLGEPADNKDFSYEYSVAYANYSLKGTPYINCLNSDMMAISSVHHLPIYKIESKAELEDFKNRFKGDLEFSRGYDEMPSFNDVTKNYNDKHFEDNTVFIVYLATGSCSFRYDVRSIYNDGNTFCVHVGQHDYPECYDTAMCGWWVIVSCEKEQVKTCKNFDADLDSFYENDLSKYLYYTFRESVDITVPYILLDTSDNTFSFHQSAMSSYTAGGKYELTDEKLILKTNDGTGNIYTFKVDGDNIIFDEKNSSPIPKYKYSENATEAKSPVPDGAVFSKDVVVFNKTDGEIIRITSYPHLID